MEVNPGYKQTEVGLIPEEWDVRPLGDLATVRDGTHQTPIYVPFGIPFFSVEHVTSGDFRNTKFISEQEHLFLTRSFKMEKGDILMTRIGSIGDCKFIDWDVDASFYVSLALLKIRQGYSAQYIAHYSKSAPFQREVELHSLQSAIPKKINLGPISKIRIAVPPLSEQRAIASALTDVDALLDGLGRLIAKKRYLKHATMQQLLTGQIRLPGFTGEWESKRLGEVVDIDPESLGSDTSADFSFNYIALEDVDHGVLRSWSEQIFVDAPSRARRKLRPDDVLVSTVRPNLRSHLLFRERDGDWVCSTGFCVVRCRPGFTHPGYVFFHLFGGSASRQIESLLTGSNYPSINSSDVRALQIPFPAFAEQAAIADVLTTMDGELATLERRREKTRGLKRAMMQELLTGQTRLFTPQEPAA